MAAEGQEEMNENGELYDSAAMDTSEQSPEPPFEVSGENGSATTENATDPHPSAAADTVEGNQVSEFERLWKAAQDNPQDFTTWTDLLQYCEQEGDLEVSRRSLEAFLARYPLCYGYWKKYADFERRAGSNNGAEEVCVRGLQVIPLSVDLWIHYVNLLLGTLDMNLLESQMRIRNVFENAIAAAGLDFHSDRLWDLYVEWEKEQGNTRHAASILDRVLKVPTQQYNTHYNKLKEHLNNNPPKDVLPQEEYEELRASCRQSQKAERAEQAQEEAEERPPGEEEPATPEGVDSEELMQKIRERVVAARDKVYQENEGEVRKRWHLEDAIKRPYFHVKPLDRLQLQAWHSYLDWEIAELRRNNKDSSSQGDNQTSGEDTAQLDVAVEDAKSPPDDHRIRILFERCLIACALYEEMWTRYIRYLEPKSIEEARAVYKRACEVHLPNRPNLHMQWATFEERHGNLAAARRILEALETKVPGLAVIRLRRAALERRGGKLDIAEALLREAVAESKDKPMLHAFYSIKLARLLLKVGSKSDQARKVLQEAIEMSPNNEKLHLNLLELEVASDPRASAEAVQKCVSRALEASLAPQTKILLSQRGLQFSEDFGNSIESMLSVYDAHQKLLKELGGTKRPAENGDEDPEKQSKTEDSSSTVVSTSAVTISTTTTAAVTAATDAAPSTTPVTPAVPHVPITTPPPPVMGADMSAQTGYGAYSSWYQQPPYGGYGYQNTWNYNQSYYPPS